MNVETLYEGAYPLARVILDAGEKITAESGAMVAMSPTLEISGEAKGGLLKSLGRKMLGGESFFQSTISAYDQGEVLLAPSAPGALLVQDGSHDMMLQKGAFLAADDSVEVSPRGQGVGKGLFSGEGFFVMQVSGSGPLVLSSYREIHQVDLDVGQEYILDNGHLEAWNCNYDIQKAASGWFRSLTSGEGLVCRFTGPGTVYIQTRNLGPFAAVLLPFLPTPTK